MLCGNDVRQWMAANVMKEIQIEFERGGIFVAKLLEKEAPRNCKMVWEHLLPYEGDAIHAAFSGEAVWSGPLPRHVKPICENPLIIGVCPGMVSFGPDLGVDFTLYKKRYSFWSDLNVVYGRFSPRTPFVGEKPTYVFARITDNLDKLYEVGKRIRLSGKEKISFTRKK